MATPVPNAIAHGPAAGTGNRSAARLRRRIVGLLLAFGVWNTTAAAGPPVIEGCPVFPPDHVWNTPIDTLPVHPNSAAWVNNISTSGPTVRSFLHPDFGPDGGIPYVVVNSNQPFFAVTFEYAGESDPGPYPIPTNAPIEGGAGSTGDRHVLVLDKDRHRLYELFAAYPNPDGSWHAGSGASFDLNAYDLRPETWTSADAAGLPILPGLVRYDEIAAGEIAHAVRFTAARTRREYLWPARHYASTLTGADFPPMGLRMRLKADYDISGFNATNRVILRALKTYGMILADNGTSWFITGTIDPRFDNEVLAELKTVPATAFEAVDGRYLMRDPDSGQARSPDPVFHAIAAQRDTVTLVMELLPNLVHRVEWTDTLSADWVPFEAFTPTDVVHTIMEYPALTGRCFYRIRR